MIPSPEAVNAFFAEQFPSAHAQGYRCMETGAGFALARWTYDATTLRPGELISGPTQFALADLALWFLSFTVVGLAPMAVTSDIHISFLRPAKGGDLWARADLLRAGKVRITGQVRLWVDGTPDKPVSHVVGAYVKIA